MSDLYVANRPALRSNSNQIPKFALIANFLLALILAARALNTAPDDWGNLAYFDPSVVEDTSNWWLYWIEEPIWTFYALVTGTVFGPEWAMRMTIFISAFAFLYSGSRLARGGWRAPALVLLVFLIDLSFATQMYYNQVRQGFALSLFMAVAAIGGGPILGAALASGIHSSFLVVLPCALATRMTTRSSLLFLASLLLVVLAVHELHLNLPFMDFGRRSQTHDYADKLNLNFYIMAIPQYALTIFLARQSIKDDSSQRWFHMTVMFVIAAFGISFIYEAGARLMYIANALVLILLAKNIRKERVLIGSVFWISILVFQLALDAFRPNIAGDNWFERWALILQ
jgi:hypothetical protein